MERHVFLSLWYLLFFGTSFTYGGEPKCSQFDYEERLLEKMIRTEIKVEKMKADIDEALKTIKTFTDNATKEVNEQKGKVTEVLATAESHTKEQTEKLLGAVEAAENALQMTKDNLRVPTVIFKSKDLADTTPSMNEILKFKTTMYNFGNGYDNITGIFTAPVNGTYLFTAQLCAYHKKYACYRIYVGDTQLTQALDYDGDGGYPCNTADAMVLLNAGDTVFLKHGTCSSGRFQEDSLRSNTFSGVLLNVSK